MMHSAQAVHTNTNGQQTTSNNNPATTLPTLPILPTSSTSPQYSTLYRWAQAWASSIPKGLYRTFEMIKRDPAVHIMVVVPFIILLVTTDAVQRKFNEFELDIDTAVKCYTMDVNPSMLSMNDPKKRHQECYRSQLPIVCVDKDGTIEGLWDIGESQAKKIPEYCNTTTAGELYGYEKSSITTADVRYTVISNIRCWSSLAIVFATWAIQGQLAWVRTNTLYDNISVIKVNNENNEMWYSKVTDKIYAINCTDPAAIMGAIIEPKRKYASFQKYEDANKLWEQIPSTVIVRHCRNFRGKVSEAYALQKDAGCELDDKGVPISVVEISHTIRSPTKVWLGVKTPHVNLTENFKSDPTVMDSNVNNKFWEKGKDAVYSWNPRNDTYNTLWKPRNKPNENVLDSDWWKICSFNNTDKYWKVGDYMSNCLSATGQKGYMDGSTTLIAGHKTAALAAMTKYERDSCKELSCKYSEYSKYSKYSKDCLCMELWGICWENEAALAILTGIWAALVTAGAALVAWILNILMFVVIKTIATHKQIVSAILPAVVQYAPVVPTPAPVVSILTVSAPVPTPGVPVPLPAPVSAPISAFAVSVSAPLAPVPASTHVSAPLAPVHASTHVSAPYP